MTGYFSEIWRLRHFWLALVRIDLRKRYRRSIIGMGWSLLQPIAMMLVLCVVFSQLLHQNIREFAPFLLSGLTFWGFVAAAVSEGCQCFLQGESYIRQQPAPLAIYALRTTLGAGFHFVLGFAIVVAFVAWTNGCLSPPVVKTPIQIKGIVAQFNYGPMGSVESLLIKSDGKLVQANFPVQPAAEVTKAATVGKDVSVVGVAEEREGDHPVYRISELVVAGRVTFAEPEEKPKPGPSLPALLSLVPTFVLLFIIGWAVAVCMGLANVMFQDSQHLIQIALQIAFYATPIIYRPEMLMGRQLVSWLIRANPLAAFLELIRAPLLDGTLPSTWAVGMASGTTVIVVALAMLALRRFEKRLIFYL